MSQVGPRAEPPPALVVLGLLSSDASFIDEAARSFGAEFGGVDLGGVNLWGEPVPFDLTDYYAPEMGERLLRRYCSFARLMPAEQLPELKWRAWQIEQEIEQRAAGKGRPVNLDVGMLDYSKVVLASFKHGPQKIYLGHKTWADMVLSFTKGAFSPLPWTFPDLKDGRHLPFF
ncbi:MAG: DUF4416 family protein, partial [Deltaproteobacteria bacterium]|nr:DUF4416 family protein [Deltaproteobacteria bacterium]